MIEWIDYFSPAVKIAICFHATFLMLFNGVRLHNEDGPVA